MNKTPKTNPMILDGAMGTELVRRGMNLPLPVWSADINFTNPEIVLKIHKDYISAGADILTTNTFRSTTYTYRKGGCTAREAKERARNSLCIAVEIARKAAGENTILAGSITSVEDCYSPQLFPGKNIAEDTYGEQVEWFMECGVDVLLFETMGNFQEISIALQSSRGLDNERWVSLILKNNKQILDGHLLEDCINMISEFSVTCLLLNCNKIETTDSAIKLLLSNWKDNWGVYPNLGKTNFDNDYFDIINDSNFIDSITLYLDQNPTVIGACCGSTPRHIEIIKSLIIDNQNK